MQQKNIKIEHIYRRCKVITNINGNRSRYKHVISCKNESITYQYNERCDYVRGVDFFINVK